ncbi:restriction endonuclease subunit S [uncultured Veillonella sp.]|uniref:restriction endonuclease subunit S n=1 Tax=uncultured Veillonella sp. TaxID=159268 RepID=UPI002803E5BA|nr:restriction endonuclease subunit S [uncultured Veillonella sp.]
MRNKPRIRFKGFTEDWEQRKLDAATTFIGDGLHGTPKYDENGTHYFINGNNLVDSKIFITEETKRVSAEALSNDDRRLNSTAILMSINGTIGVLARYNNENIMLGKSVAYITPKNINRDFLFYQLQGNVIQSYFYKNLTGTTIKNLGLGTIKNTIVMSTLPEEESEIGQFFYKIDQYITLHQRKLEKLKLAKKALLKKLFPKNGSQFPEIRFKGFTDDWEQRKFDEIYERAGRKNDLTYGIDKIISVANMYFKTDAIVGSEKYLKTYNVFKLGDIAFEGHTNKEHSYGRFVENTIGDGIVSHIFDVFTPKINLDINFWKDLIKYEPIMGPILRRCTKASRMMSNLTSKEFLEEKILCPTLEEQKLIGGFIVRLDKNITLHQRKLDKLQEVKKGLLQKMFI